MFLTGFRIAAVLAMGAAAAQAQDLVGFDADSFGSVVLSDTQSAAVGDVSFELSIGDYKNEFISTYASSAIFAQVGRSVGRLDVLTDQGVFPCTAFLVEGNFLVTNHHCVPGILEHSQIQATSIFAVKFVAGYVNEGVEAGTKVFHVNPEPLETSKELDYSVLKVLGDAVSEFGALQLATLEPEDNAPFWVIGHPMGEAQRISREQCKANTPALSGIKLLHTCDTLPGNSGSPVIDITSRMVIGLHHAGSKRSSVNYAIPMRSILAQSKVLRASVVAPLDTRPDTGAQAERALSSAVIIPDAPERMAALDAVIAEFPGTDAAAKADAILIRLRAEASVADANAQLFSALILTDSKAQADALQSVAQIFPGSPAATAALAALKRLETPVPVPAVPPSAKANPAPVTTTTGMTAISELPYGTILRVSSIAIFRDFGDQANAIGSAGGQITLGRALGGGWYEVAGRTGRFVKITAQTKFEFVQPIAPPKPLIAVGGGMPPGTVLSLSSIALYPAPGDSARAVSSIGGSITLGEYFGDGWYALAGRDGRFVHVTEKTKFKILD